MKPEEIYSTITSESNSQKRTRSPESKNASNGGNFTDPKRQKTFVPEGSNGYV